MPKPYETKRELIDDLLMLYGEAVGAAHAGQPVASAVIIERLGSIIARAHAEPAGHQVNVDRAREMEQAARTMQRPDLQRRLHAVK